MSFDKDDQLERDGAYDDHGYIDARGVRLHVCHICRARLRDDDAMAQHVGRHRKIARGDGSENDRLTNERQASRAQVDELQEMLAELRHS